VRTGDVNRTTTSPVTNAATTTKEIVASMKKPLFTETCASGHFT
jgi:hypothetical protein